jgi:tetratricopeptide (TPR) repeat protein
MKNIVKYGILLTACALTLSSCNCFKKMAQHQDQISIVANPEVLTLVGNNITTDVTVVFPEQYFNPKAIVRVTPMLVFDGGVIEGAPKYFQGEKVKDNYTVISKTSGGVYTQKFSFPWDPRARQCVLELKVEGKCKAGADFELAGVVPVAEGVNTLQQDLSWADAMIVMPDDFKRVTHETASVDIMYQVNQSSVRSGELTKAQTKLFEQFIRDNQNRDRVTLGNLQAKGYASPEGPEGLNDRLSRARSESGKTAIERQLKNKNLRYDVASYGEDWEGFKELVQNSNMKDKAMIIQVLNMYSSAAQRDTEIRNMSAVFEELKQNILPELRRTQMLATTDIQGKTDAELIAAVNSNISNLNLEETLFAATLFNEPAKKESIYRSAADRFNDARAWNNTGVAQAAQGNWTGAESSIKRATELSSNPAMANNLALSAMALGNTDEAAKYLPTAGAGAKALAEVTNGNYAAASNGLEGYNKAVADVLGGNLSAAKNALVGDNSAKADYLRGVIASKEGDAAAAVANVKSAIAKDSSLRAKALADINLKSIAAQL